MMELLERFVVAVERMAANGQAMVALKAKDEVPAPPTSAPEPQVDRTPPPTQASNIEFPDIDDSIPVEPDPTPEPEPAAAPAPCPATRRDDGAPCTKPNGHTGKHYYGPKVPLGAPPTAPAEAPPAVADPFAVQESAPAAAAPATLDFDTLADFARSVIKQTDMDTVREKITPFGVGKLAELDPSQYQAVYNAIKELVS